jgi:hypothetical protein
MGDDFSNRQCYVGDRPVDAIRSHILEAIVDELKSSSYSEVELEAEATRSLVIEPRTRRRRCPTGGSNDRLTACRSYQPRCPA